VLNRAFSAPDVSRVMNPWALPWYESGSQPWEVVLTVTTATSHEATLSTAVRRGGGLSGAR